MTKEENNILAKEIESWSNFEYSLREEDRIPFSKTLNECQKEEFSKAFNAKGKYNSTTESLFMALIFQQQKTISRLIDRLLRYKANQKINLVNLDNDIN